VPVIWAIHPHSALVVHTAGYRVAGHKLSPDRLAAVSLALALAGLVPRRCWRVGRLAITVVHEGGHAAAAILAGRKVTAVHLRSDASGVTLHRGSLSWTARLITAAAGFPAPGAVGVVGAWLIAGHHVTWWLVALTGLGAAMAVLWVRNLFGVAVMAVWLAGLGWLLKWGTAGGDALVGAVMAWYLALGGLRAAAELLGERGPSDAADLARLVRLPAGVCKVVFVAVASGAVVGCAGLFFQRG
jgi:Peptidase M50B-like